VESKPVQVEVVEVVVEVVVVEVEGQPSTVRA